MLQLGTLALDIGANLVETTLFQSYLFGIEGIYPPHHLQERTATTTALRLFEVYNSILVNDHLHKKLSPLVSMDSFEDLLSRASRDVTLIHFSTERSITPHVRRISPDSSLDLLRIKWAFLRHLNIVDCAVSGFQSLVKKIEYQLNHKLALLKSSKMSRPFKVIRVLCLNPQYTFTSKTLSKYISLPGTVVFTNWLGCCLNECTMPRSVPHRINKIVAQQSTGKHFRTKLPQSHCRNSLRFSVPISKPYLGRVRDAQLFHHPRILDAAQRQLEHLGLNPEKNGYLSIHIRIERIIRTAAKAELYKRQNKLDFIEQCVGRIVSHIQDNLVGEENLMKYLLFTDLGEHGTNSLTKPALNSTAQLFLKILKSHGVQVHHCKLELLRDRYSHNSGFVSLVEMTMLALGRRLLLVGGGGFQVNIAHKFYSLHQTRAGHGVQAENCVS